MTAKRQGTAAVWDRTRDNPSVQGWDGIVGSIVGCVGYSREKGGYRGLHRVLGDLMGPRVLVKQGGHIGR